MRNLCAPTKVVHVTPPDARASGGSHERVHGHRTPTRLELELGDVTVTFGGLTALADVSSRWPPHQVHGVIGPNGAGKTTLFNVACGFTTPDTGTLAWQGDELRGLRPHDLAGLGHRPHPAGRRPLRPDHRPRQRDGRAPTGTPAPASSSSLLGPAPVRPARSAGCASGPSRARPPRHRGVRRPATRPACPTRSARGSPWPAPWPPSRDLLLLDEPASGLSHDGDRRARRAGPRASPTRCRCCSSSTTWTW